MTTKIKIKVKLTLLQYNYKKIFYNFYTNIFSKINKSM
jgi:hypothetical protein